MKAIDAGFDHGLALKKNGSVVAWGCIPGHTDTLSCRVSPKAKRGVVAISAGSFHSLALLKDGSVVAWGCRRSNAGQCNVPPAAKSGVIAISGGGGHSLALKDDGTIVAWGCRGAFDAGECDVPREGCERCDRGRGGRQRELRDRREPLSDQAE